MPGWLDLVPLTRRRRRGLLIAAGALALLVGGVVVAEFAVRAVAQERLDAVTATRDPDGVLSGATVRLAGTPLLWQLVTGGPRAEVTLPESVVGDLLDARLDDRLGDVVEEVWFESGLVLALLEVPLGGTPTNVEVGFEVRAVDGEIVVSPALLRVGGIQLPGQALGRLFGVSAEEGIALGAALPDGLEVVSATVTDDALVTELLLAKGLAP